jgi:urease accessory protein UreH
MVVSLQVYKKPRGSAAAAHPMAPAEGGAGQRIHARVAEGGLLALLPEPVVCYAHSTYTQTQVFELAPGGRCAWSPRETQ